MSFLSPAVERALRDLTPRDRAVNVRLLHLFHDPEIGEMAKVAALLRARMANTYFTAAVMTALAACFTTTGAYVGIHTASPSTTGANEIVGASMIGYSSGGYTGTRQAITWAAYSSPGQISSDSQTFPLLATQAGGIPYFSLWTDTGATSHAGTYLGGGPTSGLSGSIPNGANVVFATGAVAIAIAD